MNPKSAKPNFTNPDINPCIEESNLSRNCLEKNYYDYSECTLYFDNYNKCKKFWGSVYLARKKANIRPFMPPKDERDYIRSELEKGNNVFSYKNNSQ